MKNLLSYIILFSSISGADFSNDGATLTITAGTTISANGTLENSNGTVNNNGTIQITGNLLSDDVFNSGIQSSINLVGNDQFISGGIYNDLTVSGAGVKSMTGDMTVNGNLTLTRGTLNLNGYELTVENIIHNGGSFSGDGSIEGSPEISSITLESDNSALNVQFNQPVYSTPNGNGSLEIGDFVVSLSGGSATLLSNTPTNLSISGTTYSLSLGLSGLPNGKEILSIFPQENAIFNDEGIPAGVNQSISSIALFNQGNSLAIDVDPVVAGDTAWINLYMENYDDIISLQVDLDYPTNMVYSGVANLTDRAVDHLLYATEINENLRIISYSPTLSTYDGSSGNIASLGFVTSLPYDTISIEMVDPILGDIASDNRLTSFENGTLIITSPEPKLSTFSQVIINEDQSYAFPVDSLEKYVFDADNGFDELQWTFSADRFTIFLDNLLEEPSYVFQPDLNWNGLDTVQIIVSDGAYADTSMLPFHVLEVNDGPSPITLISPPNSSFADNLILQFRWSELMDVDSEILESILIFDLSDHYDTIVVDGTQQKVNLLSLNYTPNTPFNWWVEASDIEITTRSDTFSLSIPSALSYEGPMWYVSVDGSDEQGDGSSFSPFATIQHAYKYSQCW